MQKRTQKYIASDNCQRARPVTAYSLPRSVGKQVSVDTLDGITGYHQYCFPSPLGLEVAAARFSSFDEGLAFKATKMDYSWNLQDEDWEKISAMVIGEN